MRELTIGASGVRAMLELAVSKGAGRDVLLERARINPSDLEDRDNRLPFSRYVALMKAGQELCNDPALALHFGETIDLSEISIAHSVGRVETMEQALAQTNRYASLGVEVEAVGNGDRFQLQRDAGQLWVVDMRRNPNDFPELTESTFARMVCSTRRAFGDTPIFKALEFTHSEPAYRAEYDRIFRVPMVFGSKRNALQVNEGLVSSFRFPTPPHYVAEVLKDHAEVLLKRLESTRTIRGRVESLLVPVLHTGEVGMESVAGKLGVSRQTLFRQLKAEGVTFEEVLEGLRCSIAQHHLSDGKTSVKETAYLVGFSDPTAFSRAFKRWTGHPPKLLRTRDAQQSTIDH